MVSKAYAFRVRHLKIACEKCYANDRQLVLHHKNRNRSDNRSRNLQTLCISCHSREHWREKLAREKKLLQAVAAPKIAPRIAPETIRKVRDALNESQGQFADRLGIKQSTLSRWESGKAPIRRAQAMMLERVISDIERVMGPV